MPTLKNIILDSINKNFPDETESEKSLFYALSMKKVLSAEYYDNRYYTASVAYMDDNNYTLHTNEYNDIGPSMQCRAIHSNDKDDYDNEYYVSDAQHYLLDKKVIERLETFQNIVRNSPTIYEYVDNLIYTQNNDPHFLPTINSYNYLFKDFDKFLLNDDVKDLLEKNKLKAIDSKLCKNTTYFSSFFSSKKDNKERNEEWKEQAENRYSIINDSKSLYKPIDNFYLMHEENLNRIFKDVYNLKPFLKEKPSEQKIDLFYIEIKGDNSEQSGYTMRDFNLERNFAIDEELLIKNNINIAPVYGLTVDVKAQKNSYNNIEEDESLKFFINHDNELNPHIHPKFFGLDYVYKKCFKAYSSNTSYIIAKVHDETVGFISFNSLDDNNKSVMKSIQNICIKDTFRGNGLAYKFYDTLANIFEEQGNILTNSMYSSEGKEKLPKLKQRVCEKHPDFLMINCGIDFLERSEEEQKKYDSIHAFNNDFVPRMDALEKKLPKEFYNNREMIKNKYRESVEYISNNYNSFKKYSSELYDYSVEQITNIQDIVCGSTQKENKIKRKI